MLRKSRTGCTTCRARRVKVRDTACDEIKPVCSNCKRRFVSIDRCDYSGISTRRKSTMSPPESQRTAANEPIKSLSLHPPSVQQSEQWRSLELYLMHHYTRHVAPTMSPCTGPLDMWTDIIPRLSFDSELVLNPLLALSAVHLRAHASTDPRLAFAAARYMDRALVQHREAVPTIAAQGLTEQLWLSATMLAFLAWIMSHEHREGEPYEMPTQHWIVRDNVSLLFVKQFERLRSMGYGWTGWEGIPTDIRTEDLWEDEQRQMRAIEEEINGLFSGFRVAQLEDERARAAYEEVRDFIFMVYRAFYSGQSTSMLRRYMGSIMTRCQLGMRQMLEMHDPLMMALMAHFTVLLKAKRLGERWWMNGRGLYEVASRTVLGMKSLMPKEYMWAMEWPCKVLSGEIELSRAEGLVPANDEDTTVLSFEMEIS
ncbi:fungal specific transcription factor domain-containing protein [Sarocladium implicatum]|nr:fungal specific transcription factor domain-containing protein [Sarocladium implicatum]